MSATTPLTSSMPGTTTSGVMTRQDPTTGKCRYIDSVLLKPINRSVMVMGLLSMNATSTTFIPLIVYYRNVGHTIASNYHTKYYKYRY